LIILWQDDYLGVTTVKETHDGNDLTMDFTGGLEHDTKETRRDIFRHVGMTDSISQTQR